MNFSLNSWVINDPSQGRGTIKQNAKTALPCILRTGGGETDYNHPQVSINVRLVRQMQHTPGVGGVLGYTETQRIKHSSHLSDTLLLQTLGQFL